MLRIPDRILIEIHLTKAASLAYLLTLLHSTEFILL